MNTRNNYKAETETSLVDTSVCGKCEGKVEKKPKVKTDQSIECDCCVHFFHIGCVAVSDDKLKAISTHKVHWYCPSCEFAAGKLKQHCAVLQAEQDRLKKELSDVQEKYEILKKKVDDTNTKLDKTEKNLTETLNQKFDELQTTINNIKNSCEEEKFNKLQTQISNLQVSCKQPLENLQTEFDTLKDPTKCRESPLFSSLFKSDTEEIDIRSIVSKELEEKKKSDLEAKKKLDEEMKLREKKKSNLIVFNVPEDHTISDQMELMKDDFSKVQEIYNERVYLAETDLLNITRIGKKNQDKIRPILLVFKNEDIRNKILRNNRDLKYKHDNISSSIYVHIDRTQQQREIENKLREELRKRKNDGETNIVIRNERIVPFRAAAQKPWASMFQ